MPRVSYSDMLEVRRTMCPVRIAQVREMSVGELLRAKLIKMPCDDELEFDNEGFARAVENVNVHTSVVDGRRQIGRDLRA